MKKVIAILFCGVLFGCQDSVVVETISYTHMLSLKNHFSSPKYASKVYESNYIDKAFMELLESEFDRHFDFNFFNQNIQVLKSDELSREEAFAFLEEEYYDSFYSDREHFYHVDINNDELADIVYLRQIEDDETLFVINFQNAETQQYEQYVYDQIWGEFCFVTYEGKTYRLNLIHADGTSIPIGFNITYYNEFDTIESLDIYRSRFIYERFNAKVEEGYEDVNLLWDTYVNANAYLLLNTYHMNITNSVYESCQVNDQLYYMVAKCEVEDLNLKYQKNLIWNFGILDKNSLSVHFEDEVIQTILFPEGGEQINTTRGSINRVTKRRSDDVLLEFFVTIDEGQPFYHMLFYHDLDASMHCIGYKIVEDELLPIYDFYYDVSYNYPEIIEAAEAIEEEE